MPYLGTADEHFITALRLHYDAQGTQFQLPADVSVDRRFVPLRALVDELTEGRLSPQEVSPQLRDAFDRQGMPILVLSRGYLRLSAFCRPHAHWTPEDFVTAMRSYYTSRRPGELPEISTTVLVGDRYFPLGAILSRMADGEEGLPMAHVTADMRRSLDECRLPVRERRNGRILIDEEARSQQLSNPEFRRSLWASRGHPDYAPGATLEQLAAGQEFVVQRNSDGNNLTVRLRGSSGAELSCPVDGRNWPVRFEQINANAEAGRAEGATERERTLADRAKGLLRASLVNTLTQQIADRPDAPTQEFAQNYIQRWRGNAARKQEEAQGHYDRAVEAVRRERSRDGQTEAARERSPRTSPGREENRGHQSRDTPSPGTGPTHGGQSRPRSPAAQRGF
jgi:hypothetical protein